MFLYIDISKHMVGTVTIVSIVLAPSYVLEVKVLKVGHAQIKSLSLARGNEISLVEKNTCHSANV